MKKFLSLIVFLVSSAVLLVYSCRKDDPNESGTTDVTVSKIIGIQGGTITMDNFASVTFSYGAFSYDTKVDLIKTENNEIRTDFERSIPLFNIDRSNLHYIQVACDQTPQNDYTEITINISEAVYQNLASGYGFKLFGLLNQSIDDQEKLINFEPIDAIYDPTAQTLHAIVPRYYFFDNTDRSGKQTLTLAIGTTPGENLGQNFPTVNNDCAMFIRCPLDVCNVTSPFDKFRLHPVLGIVRPHLGVDFQAAVGTKVYAVSDGVVKAVSAQTSEKGYVGWGKYIVIEHKNQLGQSFNTLYAHLSAQNVVVGQPVKEGDQIGLSGNTGLGTAPHLHLEYIANANWNNRDAKIDPWPFINNTSVRLKGAIGEMTGINDCEHEWGVPNSGSSWNVKFDFLDPQNSITSGATLTFQDIEPVVNPPYTVQAGNMLSQNGLVTSPTFCARFGDDSNTYFKVKVYLTLANGSQSNCVYFNLKRPPGARTDEKVNYQPSSGRPL